MQKIKSIAWGFLGVLLALAFWHAYIDHTNLHALVNMVAAQQQAAQAPAPPATTQKE